jgi:hypothetical protein
MIVIVMSGCSADWDPAYFGLAREFAARVPLTPDRAALTDLLDDCTRAIGFHHFALINHVDLSKGTAGMIHLDTYPAAWSEHFVRNRLKQAYIDNIDGKIDDDLFARLTADYRGDERKIARELDRLMDADHAYIDDGIAILGIAKMPGACSRRPIWPANATS